MVLVTAVPSFAQGIDPAVHALANEVIMDIYNSADKLKSGHPELADFGRLALLKNAYGLPKIDYEYFDPEIKTKTYAFAVEAVKPADENPYGRGPKVFAIEYKLLNIKLIGYLDRKLITQYNMKDLVLEKARKLSNRQQQLIPYEVILETTKSVYKKEEPIEFIVTLKNKTNQNLKVRDLNGETLHFLFNDRAWGTRELNPNVRVRPILLGPYESISKTFKGMGFKVSKEFLIIGTYSLPYKGAFAEGELKVKVE